MSLRSPHKATSAVPRQQQRKFGPHLALSGPVVETDSHLCSQEDVLALIDSGGSQGGSEGFHWVLDPIDGTRGFVGMRQYAVCLGLLHEGQVRVWHSFPLLGSSC